MLAIIYKNKKTKSKMTHVNKTNPKKNPLLSQDILEWNCKVYLSNNGKVLGFN